MLIRYEGVIKNIVYICCGINNKFVRVVVFGFDESNMLSALSVVDRIGRPTSREVFSLKY